MKMQKIQSLRGLQVGIIDAPLNTPLLTMLILHELPRAFLLILHSGSAIFQRLRLGVFAFFGLHRLFLLGSVNVLVMSDFLEDPLSTQILRGTLYINAAIQHADEICCCWQDQFDVMGDEDDSSVRKEGATEEFFEQSPSSMAVLDGL
jgi:hypothetical protein